MPVEGALRVAAVFGAVGVAHTNDCFGLDSRRVFRMAQDAPVPAPGLHRQDSDRYADVTARYPFLEPYPNATRFPNGLTRTIRLPDGWSYVVPNSFANGYADIVAYTDPATNHHPNPSTVVQWWQPLGQQ